jgi:hypothetical protein
MTTQTEEPLRWVPRVDSLGARLALVRHKMGWNIKEAALACGLPPGSWREWELHGRDPRGLERAAARISERTGCDEYWLMTGKTNGPHPAGPNGGECAVRDLNPEPAD